MTLDFAIQSTLHVAIIMDGNGRWALSRGLPRIAGHHAGADAVRRTVETAPSLGIGALTLFAFSSDNWRRPSPEVSALMQLFGRFLKSETERVQREIDSVLDGIGIIIEAIAPWKTAGIGNAQNPRANGRDKLKRWP